MNTAFRTFVIAGLDPAIYPARTISWISVERLQAENSMGASAISKTYGDWRNAVDKRLHQIYCITIADAGVDEEYLIRHWQSNDAPLEFVEWLGNKYDLDPLPSLVQPQERGK
jgi:hypothetical protein